MCVAYLNFEFLNLGPCGDDKAFKERLKHNPFVCYAARNWGFHVEKASQQSDLHIEHCLIEIWQSRIRADAIAQIFWAQTSPGFYIFDDSIQGDTVLHALAKYNLPTLAKKILEFDEKLVAAETVGGDSPLMYAVTFGHLDVVNILLNSSAGVHRSTRSGVGPLHSAAYYGNPDVVHRLLQAGVDVASQAKDGSTPLHWAISTGHTEIVRILLEAGSDATVETKEGKWTALHLAARAGRLDSVNRLIEAGADITAKTVEGYTPLHLAAINGSVDIVQRLFELKKTMCSDTWGDSPLHKAAVMGHLDALKLLLALGADIQAQSTDGWTALSYATYYGHLEVTKALLKAGAIAGTGTMDGSTPLHCASQNGYLEILDVLLDAGADSNCELTTGETRLASSNGRLNVINVNCQDNYGRTPLHRACDAGHVNVMERLISAHADLDIQSSDGETALHRASWNGHSIIVNELLKAGANHRLCTLAGGHTPFILALFNHKKETARQFLTATRTSVPDRTSDCLAQPLPVPKVEKSLKEVSWLQLASDTISRNFKNVIPLAQFLFAERQYDQAMGAYESGLELDARNAAASYIENVLHSAVTCDGCYILPIHGYRYKCKGCENYDLCHQCFNSKPHPHPDHEFLTIPGEQWVFERFKMEPQHLETRECRNPPSFTKRFL